MEILRKEFAFDGIIFSDDLSMEGASVAGGIVQRAEAAWSAGCDVLLVCNAPDAVASLLKNWKPAPEPLRAARLARLSPTAAWRADAAKLATGKAAVASLLA
jgi:beta-N-acetylhexosaminidase